MYFVNERLPADSAKSEDLCTWYRMTRTWIFSFYHAATLIFKVQVHLQVFIPFCKSAVAQPFRGSGCNASFNSFHPGQQSPCLPTLALHWVSQHTLTLGCGLVLQIGSGNQSIIKITLLGLRAQSGTGGYVRHAESNGQPCHNHSWGIWLTCPASHWMTGALASSQGSNPSLQSHDDSCCFCSPFSSADHCVPRSMRQGVLQRALVRLSQPWVAIRGCSNVAHVTFILDFLGF